MTAAARSRSTASSGKVPARTASTMVLPSGVGASMRTVPPDAAKAASMRRALREKLALRPNRLTVITPPSVSTSWQPR